MSAISLPKLPAIASSPIAMEVFSGLSERPKTLSPWLFYDQAGSRLFEEITELPEYYVTRTERQILAQHADEIVAAAAGGRDLSIIELGAGTATKTGLLLDAAVAHQGGVTYYPIDVSETALEEARTRLESELPEVTVEPIVADYTEGLRQNSAGGGGGRRKTAGVVHRVEHWEFFTSGCHRSVARCARRVVARRQPAAGH
jgi:L-histidine N-alpha-methyltransferase